MLKAATLFLRRVRAFVARDFQLAVSYRLDFFMRVLTILFTVSGLLLWLGEQDTRFRLDGSIALHDGATLISLFLLVGHLYLAVIHPSTRHALRGITLGDVREDWAREHHVKWVDAVRKRL